MIDSAARRHLKLQIIEKDLVRQYWRDNRASRLRGEAHNESEIPDRPPGIRDTDWWDYCAGVRARGRARARYAADYDVWTCGFPAPHTEAILRVEQKLRSLEEADREQRSAERLAERAREHARAEIERAAAIATARRQARAELAELAAAAAVERARREEAAAAWRAAPARLGSFGGALRAARSAMRIFVEDAADDLPDSGLRERAYAALVESARRHGCGWPSRGHDREALHAIERVASRSVAASAWRVVHTAAERAIRQRWEMYDAALAIGLQPH